MPPTADPRYRERLGAPAWFWVVAAFWALTLALAYGSAINTSVGVGVGLAAFALASLGLLRVSATVVVDDRGLTAGPAHLPWDAIGVVESLDTAAAKVRRGPGADPRAYLMMRGWVSTAVSVGVKDIHDPTPYWFISTRFPDRLAAALQHEADPASDDANPPGVTGSLRAPSVEKGTP
ncbi:MAG: DUF3093 domain-containing protein [Actinomycetes bacterium]